MIGLTDAQFIGIQKAGLNDWGLIAYKWLRNMRCVGKKISIHYRDFMKWHKKLWNKSVNIEPKEPKKPPISDRHIKRIIIDLAEAGFAEVSVKGFGRFEVILFDLDFVLGLKCQNETEMPSDSNSCDTEPAMARDQKAATKAGFQQQLIKTKELLAKAGFNFRLEKDLWEIVSHGLEKIEATIDYYKFKLLKKPGSIYNPEGWLREALRNNYYLDFEPPTGFIDNLRNFFESFTPT